MFRAKKELCGGVFGGEFDEEIVNDPEDFREEAVADIVPFGKALLSRDDMNVMKYVLYMYTKYSFDAVFENVRLYAMHKSNVEWYQRNLQALREYLADPKSSYSSKPGYKLYESMLTYDTCRFASYTKHDLEELVEYCDGDEGKLYVPNRIAFMDEFKAKVVAVLGEEGFEDAARFRKNLNEQKKNTKYSSLDRDNRKRFVVYLFSKGYQEPITWIFHQSAYNYGAILFLIDKYNTLNANVDYISGTRIDDDDVNDDIYEQFGLLCASSKYAELGIKDVPALMEYKIGEYDGREKVYVV